MTSGSRAKGAAAVLEEFDALVAGYRDEPHEVSVKQDGISSPLRNYYRYSVVLELFDRTLSSAALSPARLLDFGAFPGSFDRILKTIYGQAVSITVGGLGFDGNFLEFCGRHELELLAISDVDRPDPPPVAGVAEEKYDLFLALNVLEHFLYPANLLDLANRVLKPEGALVLTTDNISTLNGALNLLRGESNGEHLLKSHLFFRGSHRPHMRIYSRSELLWLLNYSGFRLSRHQFFDCRAKQYRAVGSRVVRGRQLAGVRLNELLSLAVPHFRDHHLILARKAIPFPELDGMRPAPTESAAEWARIRQWGGIRDPRLRPES